MPRWYLEQFSDSDGFLHLYDKAPDMWRRQKPKEVMHRNKYYSQTWVPEGVDPNILEKKLGEHIEPRGKVSIGKLLDENGELTDQEWADLVIYITYQALRVPKRAELAKELLRSHVLTMVEPATAQRILGGRVSLKISESVRFDFMKIASTRLYRYFLRMEWEIIQPEDEGSEFLTTDNPVTFFNPNVPSANEPGLGQIGTVVLFPLRRDRLLLMRHPEAKRAEADMLDIVPEYDPEEGGNTVIFGTSWPKDQVIRHNKCMANYSDRLTVANSKEVLETALGLLKGH